MIRIFEYVSDTETTSIKEFLLKRNYSKKCLSFLKETDGVFLNGLKAKLTTRLNLNDLIRVVFDEHDDNEMVVDTDIPLDIVYEDQDIIVVNKPAFMPVHPSYENYDRTLANALSHYYHSKGETYTNRCITRLDGDTSGFVLLARNLYSGAVLSKLMRDHQIRKQYTAIVSGNFTETDGIVDRPIYRPSPDRIERAVAENGKGHEAVTIYHVEKQIPGASLLKIETQTGRTHQIRVHMACIGHPLLGDKLYNPTPDSMPRQCLHVNRLSFPHPITGEMMLFESGLPLDMKKMGLT